MINKNPRDPEKTPREEPTKQDPIKPYQDPETPGKNTPLQDDPANQNLK